MHYFLRTISCWYLTFLLVLRNALITTTKPQDQVRQLNQPEFIAWLKLKLRTHPYWQSGHIALSLALLELRENQAAYCSALAAQALPCSPKMKATIEKILGICYLRSGQLKDAQYNLESSYAHFSATDEELAEELIATLMALGDQAAVRKIIQESPFKDSNPKLIAMNKILSKDTNARTNINKL